MELWYTKHRPKTIDRYVWRDAAMRTIIETWIKERSLPHCLFSGPPGTGKTSLALLLLDTLEIPKEDVLWVPASRERKIDELQDKVINFVQAWTFNATGLKYILLDEADKLSQVAQGMLRTEMETYANSFRIIMTCNFPRQIIQPLHSRLQELMFSTLDDNDFTMRAADILDAEHIRYEPETLLLHIARTYPDLRKCLGALQLNSRDGHLQPPSDDTLSKDYLTPMVELFKAGRYRAGREVLIKHALPEEYPAIYRYLYQNLGMIGCEKQQSKALLAIRDAVRDHAIVADQEINMAACLCELGMIASETE